MSVSFLKINSIQTWATRPKTCKFSCRKIGTCLSICACDILCLLFQKVARHGYGSTWRTLLESPAKMQSATATSGGEIQNPWSTTMSLEATTSHFTYPAIASVLPWDLQVTKNGFSRVMATKALTYASVMSKLQFVWMENQTFMGVKCEVEGFGQQG